MWLLLAFTYPLIIFRFRRQYYKCGLRLLDPYVFLTSNIKKKCCWHTGFRLLAHFELFHRSTYLFLHCSLSVPVCHSDHICSSCWLEEESETTQFRIKKWEYNWSETEAPLMRKECVPFELLLVSPPFTSIQCFSGCLLADLFRQLRYKPSDRTS